MAPVKRVLEKSERERARALGEAQQQATAAEGKLQDLEQYLSDYVQAFQQRARAGNHVLVLRDFQVFLSRLEEAVKQQKLIVAKARDEVAGNTRQWQGAARQVKAVDTVVGRWQADERRVTDRREQRETDERAQRKTPDVLS